jgi:hypothetical protein
MTHIGMAFQDSSLDQRHPVSALACSSPASCGARVQTTGRPLPGGRRPRTAAFIGVQQVQDGLPARRLTRLRAPGGPGAGLPAAFRPAGREASIHPRCPHHRAGAGHAADFCERHVHDVPLDAAAGVLRRRSPARSHSSPEPWTVDAPGMKTTWRRPRQKACTVPVVLSRPGKSAPRCARESRPGTDRSAALFGTPPIAGSAGW